MNRMDKTQLCESNIHWQESVPSPELKTYRYHAVQPEDAMMDFNTLYGTGQLLRNEEQLLEDMWPKSPLAVGFECLYTTILWSIRTEWNVYMDKGILLRWMNRVVLVRTFDGRYKSEIWVSRCLRRSIAK